jgi:hypothetical protein
MYVAIALKLCTCVYINQIQNKEDDQINREIVSWDFNYLRWGSVKGIVSKLTINGCAKNVAK